MKTILASFLLATLMAAAHAQGSPAAGQVVFVSGVAELVSADGKKQPVVQGSAVRQGDQITTAANAYVHVRMVDNAFVAVRPGSRLHVELYEYDASAPAASRIKLQLHNGNARTVSGKGGEAAKHNYRFNTPMAAIGLRGTDYTVLSTDEATRVSVSRGAVAVTPLGEGCSAGALGPCATGATRELNAGLSHAYMEVSARNRTPVLVRPEQDPQGGAGQNPPARPEEPRAENKGEAKLAASKETATQVTADRLAATLPTVPAEPPKPHQLVWGRWMSVAEGPGSPTVVSLLGPEREIAVGNDVFGLVGPPRATITMPANGVFNFQMAGAEAYTLSGNALGPAQVRGGNFSIDFSQRAFSTGLSVSHAGGTEQLKAQGTVQHQGLLTADPARSNMTLNGLLANGGTEAAYLFEKSLTSGGMLGAVRWVR